MAVVYLVVLTLAGLGILLYGMSLFSRALETSLGSGFSKRFSKVASSPMQSYLVGGGLTFITQKVTLVCGMIMGFVDVGTISGRQSIAFVLGISFGSALSMILMMFQGFNLTTFLTLFCIIGAFCALFVRSSKGQKIAQGCIGFGMLFLGIELVGTYSTEIFQIEAVYNFLSAISHPAVVAIIGLVISFVTTSTFASLTVLAALVGASAGAGPVTIEAAYLGMLAIGIGSALSDYVYTISGQSVEAKRVVTFHVLFRLFTFIIFFPLYFSPLISWLYVGVGESAVLTLIIVHMVQMTLPSLILLPFSKPLSALMEKIVPNKKSKDDIYSEFVLPDNVANVFSVGYPSLLKSTKRLLEINKDLSKQLLSRITEKKEIRGISGKIKGFEKVVKITSNTTIRLSSKVAESELPKLNTLLNILSDISYLADCNNKLYSVGTDIIKKNKSIIEAQGKDIIKIFGEMETFYDLDTALIETLINGQNIDNKQLKIALEHNRRIFSLCQKNKKSTFSDYRKTGHYPRGTETYFGIIAVLEDANVDLANISIKLGIL